MLALAFECAGFGLSAALGRDGDVLQATRLEMDRGQPAHIVPALQALLARAEVRPTDLDRIAVTLGPGGFTGIRLGISVGLGLARSTGATFYGVNAFDVFALSESSISNLCIAIESRRAELFIRRYDQDGAILGEDAVLTAEQVLDSGALHRVIGSAASKISPKESNSEPDMTVLAAALSKIDLSGSFLAQARDQSTPIYLRAPEIGQKKTA